jgi:glycosyltransferase involved in cell wall biosynthesis
MKLSVALCTYNGEKFIREQLESILQQRVKVHEIVVCDDASTDNTIQIVDAISRRNLGIISVYYNNNNVGAIKNFEKSISLTTGDFIFLADQDDIWRPDKTEKMISKFGQESRALLVFSNGELIDESGLKIGSTLWDEWGFTEETRNRWRNNESAFEDLLVNRNKVTGATVALRRRLKDLSLPIDVPEDYWHDAFLSLNASALDGLFFIEECLIDYRIHKSQQVGIPNNFKSNYNTKNFFWSISYVNFLFKMLKNVNSWTLRVKIIIVLVRFMKRKLNKGILFRRMEC